MSSRIVFLIGVLLLAGPISACQTTPSPEPTVTPDFPPLTNCGERVYSREEEEGILLDYFNYISLFDYGTGESLRQDQAGSYLMNTTQHPAVGYQSVFPNHLRLCIQRSDKSGTVVFDETVNTDGRGTWEINRLPAGDYVIRIIVKNMVIESFDLKVETASGPETPGLPALEGCGENLYSREEEKGIRENYFTHLILLDLETEERVIPDRNGNHLLSTGQYPGMRYRPAFPNHLRLCIQAFDRQGMVVFDQTINTPEPGTWPLPPLQAGRYLMRVIVKNMVIDSLVLKVSE